MTAIAAKTPKSLLKATDIHISVAYFFSVDYVVDIVYIYPANILYKKKLALVYTKRNLLILIRKNIARVYTKRTSPHRYN